MSSCSFAPVAAIADLAHRVAPVVIRLGCSPYCFLALYVLTPQSHDLLGAVAPQSCCNCPLALYVLTPQSHDLLVAHAPQSN